MIFFWLATVVPALILLLSVLPEFARQWKSSGWSLRLLVSLLWVLLTIFLMCRPHDDNFTGLDNTAYRKMASAFLQGRGFHDEDTILNSVPKELRKNMLYRRGPRGRPTRDLVFQLSGWSDTSTKPFFVPTLPLAAAGQGLFNNPDMFTPMMGSLWIGLLLVICFTAGGGWGVLVALALLAATAWPAWFLRGYYPEAVGAVLVALAAQALWSRSHNTAVLLSAAFALGFSVCYHPTMIVLAIPMLIILLLNAKSYHGVAIIASGFALGFLPLVAILKWVCQPYGNLLSISSVLHLVRASSEHRAMAIMLICILAVVLTVFLVSCISLIRRQVEIVLKRTPRLVWILLACLPPALLFMVPSAAKEALRGGGLATINGMGFGASILFLVAFIVTVLNNRQINYALLAIALYWAALFFMFIKGIETPVGLWSQRRFVPVIILSISLFAPPFAEFIAEHGNKSRWRGILIAACLLICGGWNIVRWPAPFWEINESGSSDFMRRVSNRIGEEPLVVFDYFPHSVPYAAELNHKVLGLGEDSQEYWPEVSRWLASVAQTQEVWLATSWSPTALEDGFSIELMFSETGVVSHVNAKVFYPAVKDRRRIVNQFSRAVPVGAEIGRLRQEKVLDGSPIGLRGPWRQMSDGAWTRQSGGIIGPIPEAGGRIRIVIECAWFPPEPEWDSQTLRIAPPWGGKPCEVVVSSGEPSLSAVVERPVNDDDRTGTGVYEFDVVRPFDPSEYGLSGYDKDLGVLVRSVIIEPVAAK